MKYYQEQKDFTITPAVVTSYAIANISIPKAEGNRDYTTMLEEVAAGEAEILPAVPPVPVPISIITRLAFRNRFTMAEKQGIYTAAETSVDIRIFLDDIAVASDIDLADSQTVSGVESLETAGLISAGRAAEILAQHE